MVCFVIFQRIRPYLLIALTIWQFAALAASQAPQTQLCATNLDQLAEIATTNFPQAFPDPNYIYRLEGGWEGGKYLPVRFELHRGKPFLIRVSRTELFKICPQPNRTFYIYQASDPSVNAFARYTGKQIRLFDAPSTSMAMMAEGYYNRSTDY